MRPSLSIKVGTKIANWTVLETGHFIVNKTHRCSAVKCLCVCGEKRIVRSSKLLQGKSRSCGCVSACKNTEKSFWEKVVKTAACWLFDDTNNYGRFYINGKKIAAHRYSWELVHGKLPDDKKIYICHTCDIPRCVKPSHLFLGDNSANMRDMWAKKRHKPIQLRGEMNPHSKLTWTQVREIRGSSDSMSILAKRYGVTYFNIRKILQKKSWKEENV